MRINTSVALCLLAGSLSSALPAPQQDSTTGLPPNVVDTGDDLALLESLAAFAAADVKSELSGNGNVKRGTCNLNNLAVRREWSVVHFPS